MIKQYWDYKNHDEIDPLMVDYLLGMCDEYKDIKEMPLEDINEFLNDAESWYDNTWLDKRPDFWEHYCSTEKTTMGVGKGEPCNWCGKTEESYTDADSMS